MSASVLSVSSDPRCAEIYARIVRHAANGDDAKLLQIWLDACKLECDPGIGGRSRWIARQVREHLEPMFLVAS